MANAIITHIEKPIANMLGDMLLSVGEMEYRWVQSESVSALIEWVRSTDTGVLFAGTDLVRQGDVRALAEVSASPSFRMVLVADGREEDLIREGLVQGITDVLRTPFDRRAVRKIVDSSKTPDMIHAIKMYIDEHYHQPLTLKAIAERFYINHVCLGQLFKDTYGILYKEYLAAVRVYHASDLLSRTDFRIDEIAERTGFGSTGYFAERFDQFTGMTPARYRKEFRGKTG